MGSGLYLLIERYGFFHQLEMKSNDQIIFGREMIDEITVTDANFSSDLPKRYFRYTIKVE